MDPEKLNSIYSKAICSPAITRQNLSRKMLKPPAVDNNNDEDDAHFFESLKKKINIGSLNRYYKNKYESKKSYVIRKKKHSFHEESTNIIKRFKETIEHKTNIEVDAIKLNSQAKNICEDNITSCINNNTTEQSVNINVDNECCMLSRAFTIIFQPEKPSTDGENNESKLMKSHSIFDIENSSIKKDEILNKK